MVKPLPVPLDSSTSGSSNAFATITISPITARAETPPFPMSSSSRGMYSSNVVPLSDVKFRPLPVPIQMELRFPIFKSVTELPSNRVLLWRVERPSKLKSLICCAKDKLLSELKVKRRANERDLKYIFMVSLSVLRLLLEYHFSDLQNLRLLSRNRKFPSFHLHWLDW